MRIAYQHNTGYDIIGDVHGFFVELEQLLINLGYQKEQNGWLHPTRKAVFVGDFMFRGPDSRKVISLIKKMVKNGNAHTILGNHEMNALLWYSKAGESAIADPGKAGKPMMKRLIAEYIDAPDKLDRDIKWLKTLPFYLDFGQFRVAHAYWTDANIEKLDALYSDGKLKRKTLKELSTTLSPAAKALEETIRGIELKLPADFIVKDSKNVSRNSLRLKWWLDMNGRTFKEMTFGSRFVMPEYTIPNQLNILYNIYNIENPPLFVGHYCMSHQLIQTPNICCVDSCVASGGRIAAYRYDGEEELTADKLIFS